MILSSQREFLMENRAVQFVSYFKNNMAAILQALNENQGTMIITQNGEAKAAIMDIHQAYEALQETLAMLEMVAQGNKSKAAGRYRPAGQVLKDFEKDKRTSPDVIHGSIARRGRARYRGHLHVTFKSPVTYRLPEIWCQACAERLTVFKKRRARPYSPQLSRTPHFEYRQIIQNKLRVIYQVAKPNVLLGLSMVPEISAKF